MSPSNEPKPFVGPRPFGEADTIYGRDLEVSELRYFVGAKRIVLLYAPSGAGKSSLLQARNGLITKLRDSGRFDVWGPARVNSAPDALTVKNRFVWSAITEFDKSHPGGARPPEALLSMTLAEYVNERAPDSSPLLVFDQFEEVLRVDPVDTAAKHAFFDQLGELLYDPGIWALFVLREDYLAALQPYARQVPTHLQNRFRIDFLRREDQALDAVTKPLAAQDVTTPSGVIRTPARTFATGVAEKMLEDLATVKSLTGDVVGDYVEPLQLQIVCTNLWARIEGTDAARDIVASDIGSISDALSTYYATGVQRDDQGLERQIRTWFDEKLITRDGVRNLVRSEARVTAGLANGEIDTLVDAYLVRKEPRAGAMWLELSHDRLVEPVRTSNARWLDAHIQKFQQYAAQWKREGKPDALLFLGADLEQANVWADANPQLLSKPEEGFPEGVDMAFLAESTAKQQALDDKARQTEELRQALEREAQQTTQLRQALDDKMHQARKIRQGLQIAVVAALVAGGIGIYAMALRGIAEGQTAKANAATLEAQRQAADAKANAMAAHAMSNLPLQSRRALQLAILAYQTAPVSIAESALHAALLGRRVEQMLTLGRPVAAVAFHGSRIAAISLDGKFDSWDSGSGTSLGTSLQTPMTDASAAAFSPDGGLLAVGDKHGIVQVWEATTGALRYRLETQQGGISALAFSRNADYLASGSFDTSIRLWNGQSGGNSGKGVRGLESDVTGLAFGAADTLFYGTGGYGDGGSAAVGAWRFKHGQRSRVKDARYLVTAIASRPDGNVPVTGHGDRLISIDTREFDSGHSANINAIAFEFGSGERFATGGTDGITKIWEGYQSFVDIGERQTPVTAVGFNEDGSLLASAGQDGLVFLFRTSEGPAAELVKKDLRQGEASTVKFTPDSTRFAVGTRQSQIVTLWDARTGQSTLNVDTGLPWTASIDFTADGQYMVTDGLLDQRGKLWNLAHPGAPIGFMPHPGGGIVGPVGFSPDESHIVTQGHEGLTKFWRWRRGEDRVDLEPDRQLQLKDWAAGANGFAYLEESRFLTQAWKTGLLTEWDLKTNTPVLEWSNGQGMSTTLSMSPDGTHFITTGENQTVQIWDTATRKGEFLTDRAGRALYAPKGNLFATGGADGSVRLWDATTHVMRAELPGHMQQVMGLDFSKDGMKLVSSSSDGTVQVYTLDPADLMRLAQARAFGTLSTSEIDAILGGSR